jgi:protease-4
MQFLGVMPRPRPSEPHVALVYAVGSIIDGQGKGIIGAREEIASRPLSAAIRALAADDKVNAIVLRIDSGGGSALASELILSALDEAGRSKPVVVSMAGVAASGGYYIACHADKIFALDNTLTGSIGVLGGKIVVGDAFDKLGIKTYPMGRGKRALLYSPTDPWNADERAAVRSYMEEIYKTFVTHVSNGRSKSFESIHEIAQGRVWTGADARQRGLVDEVGGLDAALAEARKLGEVDADVALEVYPPQPTLSDIIGSFGQVQAPLGLSAGLDARFADTVEHVARGVGVAEARVIADSLRTLSMLRDSQVLAATLFPVVFQ